MARTGTKVIADLDQNRDITVVQYGEDQVNEIIQREFAAHNAAVTEALQSLAIVTTERMLRSGSGDRFDFEETDEQARERTQKVGQGQTVGFPLRRYRLAHGWTADWLEVATLAEVQRDVIKAREADLLNIERALKIALFRPTNYDFFDEYGLPQADLKIKALYNADGSQMGIDQSGNVVDSSTHNHYLANATLTEALVDTAVRTVIEHGYEQGVEIHINETNTAAFAALSKFTPALGPLVTPGANVTVANVTNDGGRLTNAIVGVWDGRFYVRTKRHVPANYFSVTAVGQTEDARPLAFREHQRENVRGMRLVGQNRGYPLQSDYIGHFFGVSVYNRGAASVAQFNSGTYTQPAF